MFKIIFSLLICLCISSCALSVDWHNVCTDGTVPKVCAILLCITMFTHWFTIRVANSISVKISGGAILQNVVSLIEIFLKCALIPVFFYLISNTILKVNHSFALYGYCKDCIFIISASLLVILVSYIVLQPKNNKIRLLKLTDDNAKKFYYSVCLIAYDIACVLCFMKLVEDTACVDLFLADLLCRTIIFIHLLMETYRLTGACNSIFQNSKIAFIGRFGHLARYVNKKLHFILCVVTIFVYGHNVANNMPCFYQFLLQFAVSYCVVIFVQVSAVLILAFATKKSLQVNAMNIGRFGTTLRLHLYNTANIAVSVLYAITLYSLIVFLLCDSENFVSEFGFLYVTLKAVAQVYIVFFLYKCIELYMSYKVEKLYVMKGGRSKTLRSVLPMVVVGIKFVVVIIGILLILANYGVDLTPVYTTIVGLAVPISLAAKSTVTSFIKGFMMLLEDEVEIGDCIETSGVKGIVEDLGIRTLKIRAFDGTLHIIPYEIINVVSNSSKDYTLHLMEAYCPVDVNINDFVAALDDVRCELSNNDNIRNILIKNQNFNFIRVKTFDNCGTNISWGYQTKPDVVGAFECEFYAALRKKLDLRGIPYPKFIGKHLRVAYKATV